MTWPCTCGAGGGGRGGATGGGGASAAMQALVRRRSLEASAGRSSGAVRGTPGAGCRGLPGHRCGLRRRRSRTQVGPKCLPAPPGVEVARLLIVGLDLVV